MLLLINTSPWKGAVGITCKRNKGQNAGFGTEMKNISSLCRMTDLKKLQRLAVSLGINSCWNWGKKISGTPSLLSLCPYWITKHSPRTNRWDSLYLLLEWMNFQGQVP